MGREVFYAALWGSALMSPSVRLPASLFVVGHISRAVPPREQKYMLGTDHQLTVGACACAWTPRDRGSEGLEQYQLYSGHCAEPSDWTWSLNHALLTGVSAQAPRFCE